jgi:hypothetical protein
MASFNSDAPPSGDSSVSWSFHEDGMKQHCPDADKQTTKYDATAASSSNSA